MCVYIYLYIYMHVCILTSLENPSMPILQEYIYMVLHGAAVTYADLDQGLVEVLLGRCCRDPTKIMPEALA